MERIVFCTPCAETFEGLNKSGDGRDKPNKLAWQVHEYVERYRSRIEYEVLSSDFTGWLMGFPHNWLSQGEFKLLRRVYG